VWNEFDPATGEMATPVISATTMRTADGSKLLQRAIYDARSIFAAHVDEQPIMMHYVRNLGSVDTPPYKRVANPDHGNRRPVRWPACH
jgi:hypothetical protein